MFYINEISDSAKVILKDNYKTLNFTKEMRTILDEHDLPLSPEASADFNRQLIKEEHNVTEPGELAAVKNLRKAFNELQYVTAPRERLKLAEREARKHLRTIDNVNLRAIVLKNDKAHQSVEDASVFRA
ncbi:hypothetical protein [Mucilaginibacter humi]|uniref:hypothetical protein n=1 Tax=Mucilaginibacter humi TaxID=2732510 RepID=UPI001FE6D615|nr:hypothetical protein [Mucilaginibacter humi]